MARKKGKLSGVTLKCTVCADQIWDMEVMYAVQEQIEKHWKHWREGVKLLVKNEGPPDAVEQMDKEEAITVPVYNGREEEPVMHLNSEKMKEIIDLAMDLYREKLECAQCERAGTLTKDGNNRYVQKALECNCCKTQTMGHNVTALLNKQLGSKWMMKTAQTLSKIEKIEMTEEGNGQTAINSKENEQELIKATAKT